MARETMVGEVVRYVYRSEDRGAIAVVKVGKDTHKVVGYFGESKEGTTVRMDGEWADHPRYGRQFRAELVVPELPLSKRGLKQWLTGLEGVGEKTADALVALKGVDWLVGALNGEHSIDGVPGVQKKHRAALERAQKQHGAQRSLALFLHSIGVSPTFQARILKQFGDRALEVIQSNPYLLTQVRGIGFKKADVYAQGMGWEVTNPRRIHAGLVWVMEALADGGADEHIEGGVDRSGHTCADIGDFTKIAGAMLSVGPDVISEALSVLLGTGELVQRGRRIFSRAMYNVEVGAARSIRRLLSRGKGNPITEAAMAEFEAGLGSPLSEQQRAALVTVTSSPVAVLTGLPGTGKTTVVKAIVSHLQGQKLRVYLCAPTGKAARRLRETSGVEATTVHRLLGYEPTTRGFVHTEHNRLKSDAVIVDEASMVDGQMLRSLLLALPDTCQLILVGDPRQLPSVGAGQVLSDLIAGGVPSAELTKIYRQAQGSGIVLAAHAINEGRVPDLVEWDGARLRRNTAYRVECAPDAVNAQIARILAATKQDVGADPMLDTQVLSPMKGRAGGADAVNEFLGGLLNPDGASVGRGLKVGDKVIQLRNRQHLGISNGDVGFVQSRRKDGGLVVDFGLTVPTEMDEEDARDLAPGYALTVHKSQGSEYPVVIVVLLKSHYVMLCRQIFYTAITRARAVVFVVGEKSAIRTAVNNNAPSVRWTALADLLREQE